MSNDIEQQTACSSKIAEKPEDSQSKGAEIDKLMAEGKKLQLSGNLDEAADKFSSACELSTGYFGEFATESYLPYLLYGKTLIDIARIDANNMPFNAPVNDALSDDEEDAEEGEENGQEKEEGEKMEEDGNDQTTKEVTDDAEHKDNENSEAEKNEENSEEKVVDEEQNSEEKVTEEDVAECPADETLVRSGEELTKVEEEGEENELELGWNCLEVARKICEMQEENPFWLECRSDVRMALGDCLCVSEEFGQALGEFNSALAIRKNLFASIDRRIAESYFQIGLTYKNMNKFNKAAEQFEETKKVLSGNIEAKEKELEANTDSAIAEELVELKEIVQLVEENIKDSLESAEMRAKQIAEITKDTEMVKKLVNEMATSGEVDDLTELVKRKPIKRPLNEEAVEHTGEAAAKELKVQNGNAADSRNGNADSKTADAEVKDDDSGELKPQQQKRIKLIDEDEAGKQTA